MKQTRSSVSSLLETKIIFFDLLIAFGWMLRLSNAMLLCRGEHFLSKGKCFLSSLCQNNRNDREIKAFYWVTFRSRLENVKFVFFYN